MCRDSCRLPRKTITLYFTFPFSVIISARVLYALSCPIVSKPLSKRISYLAIPHPNTRRRQRPAPTIHTQCRHHSYNVIKAQQKCPPDHKSKSQVHVLLHVLFLLLLLLLPVCLPTCTHPPTFASPNAAFATSAPSVGSAKSPHGCLCHLTPIHSQIVMRLVLRRLVVKDGLVWSRRVLVRWSGCDAWRRRRSTIVILVGGHLHFFSFLFFFSFAWKLVW